MSDAEEVPYQCTVEGGEPSNTSRGVTGKVTIQYPNGDRYEGLLKNGVRHHYLYMTSQYLIDQRRKRQIYPQGY